MKTFVDQVKQFEGTYGFLVKYAIILLIGGVAFIGDNRYLTRMEVQEKEVEYNRIRTEDLKRINQQIESFSIEIDRLRSDNVTNTALLNEIKATVRGIEAQTEILIRRMERDK